MKSTKQSQSLVRSGLILILAISPLLPAYAQPTGLRIIESVDATTTITQYGITWTFDSDVAYGRYINGDYWVVGPVTLVDVTRPARSTVRDGSMINPIPSTRQGYDDRWASYVETLNVANQLPLTVRPGSSLVSSISRDPETTGTRVRPVLEVAAVLTVVDGVQPSDAFRPPYAGDAKPTHLATALRTELLYGLDLAPVAETPSISAVENLFQKPWLDHVLTWQGDDFHPRQNMQNWGGGMSRDVTIGALRLLLNDPEAAKSTLLKRYVQLGIDNYALVKNGATWGNLGGTIGPGRKLPILIAAIVLDDNDMSNVAHDFDTRVVFQEDHQTFALTQAAKDGTYHADNCAAGANWCHEGWYDELALGTPVWGERAYRWETTGYNIIPGNLNYRFLTYRTTMGSALTVRLLEIEHLWNYEPFLAWTDRLRPTVSNGSWGSQFVFNMWDAYR